MLEALLTQYGVAAVFLGAATEGEASAIFGGILAQRGSLTLFQTICAVVCGSFMADQLLFLVGRRLKHSTAINHWTSKPAFSKVLTAFERHPTSFVFAFRFLYGIRTISPVVLGTTDLPGRVFLRLNGAAAMIWGSTFSLAGYLFGTAIESYIGELGSVTKICGVFAACLVLLLALRAVAKASSRKGVIAREPRSSV